MLLDGVLFNRLKKDITICINLIVSYGVRGGNMCLKYHMEDTNRQ
jgi:hypothetical protein